MPLVKNKLSPDPIAFQVLVGTNVAVNSASIDVSECISAGLFLWFATYAMADPTQNGNVSFTVFGSNDVQSYGTVWAPVMVANIITATAPVAGNLHSLANSGDMAIDFTNGGGAAPVLGYVPRVFLIKDSTLANSEWVRTCTYSVTGAAILTVALDSPLVNGHANLTALWPGVAAYYKIDTYSLKHIKIQVSHRTSVDITDYRTPKSISTAFQVGLILNQGVIH